MLVDSITLCCIDTANHTLASPGHYARFVSKSPRPHIATSNVLQIDS